MMKKYIALTGLFVAFGFGVTKAESEYQRITREKKEKKIANAIALRGAVLANDWAEVRRLARTYGPQFLINLDVYMTGHKTFPAGFSPLSIAAYRGDLETVKALVESGANVNYIGTYKSTALVSAAKRPGNIAVVKYLGDNGGYTSFHGNMATNTAADEEIKEYLEDKRIDSLLGGY